MRSCWLNDCANLGIDYKFFVGVGQGAEQFCDGISENVVAVETGDDFVVLPRVPDDMAHLTLKTQDKLRWALARGYSHCYCCFPDTYCRPERLFDAPFAAFDYLGDFRSECAQPDNFASGGPGYFLSRRTFSLLMDAPIEGVWRDDEHLKQAEDLFVGQILARHYTALGLRYFDDQRFINHGRSRPGPLGTNDVISTHLSCPDPYTSDAMLATHKYWLESQ